MMNQIIQPIVTDLKNLSFIEKIFGIVEPLQVKIPDGQGGVIEKTYPIALNDYEDNCNLNSVYLDCVPDSKKKSLLYFENDGWTIISDRDGKQDISATVRLVFWCNIKLIDKTIKTVMPIMANIMNTIPTTLPNSSPFTMIRIGQKQVITDVNNVFGKYSYDEAERQYYIYPFGFFAIDYEFLFRYNANCVEPIIIDPDLC